MLSTQQKEVTVTMIYRVFLLGLNTLFVHKPPKNLLKNWGMSTSVILYVIRMTIDAVR